METTISQESSTRWRFLVDNPAVIRPGWLPTGAEVPELADLAAEHARLLATQREAVAETSALRAHRDAEEEARRSAQEREFLGKGEAGELPPITVTDEELLDARVRSDAARDAFQTFVKQAILQVREREANLREGLKKIETEAAIKEEEAQELLDEANQLKASTLRLKAWLDRTTGQSPLGHVPWSDLPTPVQPEPLTVADLHEAASPPWGVVELHDPASRAFGTDDPDDLDPNSAAARPWEVALND